MSSVKELAAPFASDNETLLSAVKRAAKPVTNLGVVNGDLAIYQWHDEEINKTEQLTESNAPAQTKVSGFFIPDSALSSEQRERVSQAFPGKTMPASMTIKDESDTADGLFVITDQVAAPRDFPSRVGHASRSVGDMGGYLVVGGIGVFMGLAGVAALSLVGGVAVATAALSLAGDALLAGSLGAVGVGTIATMLELGGETFAARFERHKAKPPQFEAMMSQLGASLALGAPAAEPIAAPASSLNDRLDAWRFQKGAALPGGPAPVASAPRSPGA